MGATPAILHFTSDHGHQIEVTLLHGGDDNSRASHVKQVIKQAFLNAYGITETEVLFDGIERDADVSGRAHGEMRIDGEPIPPRYYDLSFPNLG